jgi:predicted dehydrogenase
VKKLRFAFAGFRHDHITSLYAKIAANSDCEIVAAAESDVATVERLTQAGKVTFTHNSIAEMLDTVECDVVAIGDCYGKRGKIVIDALKRGKHVISDKPLCTDLNELAEIKKLALEKNLSIGCMYTIRDSLAIAGVKQLIDEGKLGTITQIQFTAQHPLMRKNRPSWYFEDNMHGGTINDIACHAFDIIPYLANSPVKRIVAARTWQAIEKESSFNDAAQLMVELENNCGVMGDVSYSALDVAGYTNPCYWRFNIWGTNGMIEFHNSSTQIRCFINGSLGESLLSVPATKNEGYLEGFLNEVNGKAAVVSTQVILDAAYWSLMAQKLADNK